MLYNKRRDAERFVSALYRGILRREPSPVEMASHSDAILSGRSHASVAEDFVCSEEFRAVSAVKLFVPPGHFYSPIVEPEEAEKHLMNLAGAGLPLGLPDIALDKEAMVRTWHELLPYLSTIPFPDTKTSPFRYFFDNPNYSWGDGSVLHAILRRHRPKRIIEIGSGYSSACTLDTVDHYLDGTCELFFIEPHPSLLREIIGDISKQINILDKAVQQVPPTFFDQLEAGDILFIDSTHVLRTGSDVCFELFEILPRLASGVLVHFHDIFWPFEYPKAWVVDDNRSWNEVYAVRAFLTSNSAWRIVFFNDYMAKFGGPMIGATFPIFTRNPGGALWLQRR
jgi:predicted O-methyltransferase YrrM